MLSSLFLHFKTNLRPISIKHFIELLQDKKEETWVSPMTKAPTPTEMSKGQSDHTNNATKNFD